MRHRIERIRWPVAALAGVVVAGSGTAYAVTRDGTTAHYRTVRATKADVEQVLSTSGTVDAAHRADLGFGTSGTVASVAVAVGDTVKAGQVVARLDTTTLEAAVTKARAGVAKALAQLESDRNAQAQAVSDAASSPTKPAPSKPTQTPKPTDTSTTGSTSDATAAALQQLKQQQAAVLQAQSAATTAIAAAKDALTAQTTACANAYQDTPSAGSDTAGQDSSAQQTASDNACAAALAEVQARQADVSTAQDSLQKALTTLADTLDGALATLTSSSASPSGASPSSSRTAAKSAATSKAATGTDASNGSTSGTVSAARLAADQASIEQARADLVDARLQLRQAVLRSTRSGRVVSVPVSTGDRVSAGDVGAVVVGGTAVTVEASVPQTKIGEVHVGESVRVTTPAQSGAAEGRVTAIGLVADSSSGTPSYTVTVTVEDPAISLPAGSQALLAVVVATAKDVVTVPTSAITRRGAQATVRTWDGTTLTRKTVTLGTVGPRQVEVTGGLSAGDRVVLADLDQAITGAADQVNDRGGFSGPVKFTGGGPGGPPVTFGTPSK